MNAQDLANNIKSGNVGELQVAALMAETFPHAPRFFVDSDSVFKFISLYLPNCSVLLEQEDNKFNKVFISRKERIPGVGTINNRLAMAHVTTSLTMAILEAALRAYYESL